MSILRHFWPMCMPQLLFEVQSIREKWRTILRTFADQVPKIANSKKLLGQVRDSNHQPMDPRADVMPTRPPRPPKRCQCFKKWEFGNWIALVLSEDNFKIGSCLTKKIFQGKTISNRKRIAFHFLVLVVAFLCWLTVFVSVLSVNILCLTVFLYLYHFVHLSDICFQLPNIFVFLLQNLFYI